MSTKYPTHRFIQDHIVIEGTRINRYMYKFVDFRTHSINIYRLWKLISTEMVKSVSRNFML
jgi:hypothetical protein